MENTTIEYDAKNQIVITSLTAEQSLYWARRVIEKSTWRNENNWYYPNTKLPFPNGEIFLSENKNNTEPLTRGFLGNERLLDSPGYTYQLSSSQILDPEMSRIILYPIENNSYSLIFYLKDLRDSNYFCPIHRIISSEKAIQIVAWCIENKKRVYDYCSEFFGLALNDN